MVNSYRISVRDQKNPYVISADTREAAELRLQQMFGPKVITQTVEFDPDTNEIIKTHEAEETPEPEVEWIPEQDEEAGPMPETPEPPVEITKPTLVRDYIPSDDFETHDLMRSTWERDLLRTELEDVIGRIQEAQKQAANVPSATSRSAAYDALFDVALMPLRRRLAGMQTGTP